MQNKGIRLHVCVVTLSLSDTIIRIRKETNWGYTKIIQALRRLGYWLRFHLASLRLPTRILTPFDFRVFHTAKGSYGHHTTHHPQSITPKKYFENLVGEFGLGSCCPTTLLAKANRCRATVVEYRRVELSLSLPVSKELQVHRRRKLLPHPPLESQ